MKCPTSASHEACRTWVWCSCTYPFPTGILLCQNQRTSCTSFAIHSDFAPWPYQQQRCVGWHMSACSRWVSCTCMHTTAECRRDACAGSRKASSHVISATKEQYDTYTGLRRLCKCTRGVYTCHPCGTWVHATPWGMSPST